MDRFFKAEAVVLATIDFGDANRVVTFFTKEYGKIEANAYGCRRMRNPLSGAMQIFNHLSIDIEKSATVYRVHDADLIGFYKITDDLIRLAYASLFFEIVNKMTPLKQEEEGVFFLLLKSLAAFERRNPRIAAIISTCQFMQTTGFQLSFNECVICGNEIIGDASMSLADGGAVCDDCLHLANNAMKYPEGIRHLFLSMLAFDWKDSTKLTIMSGELDSVEKFMLKYIQSIIDAPLKTLKFLRQINEL